MLNNNIIQVSSAAPEAVSTSAVDVPIGRRRRRPNEATAVDGRPREAPNAKPRPRAMVCRWWARLMPSEPPLCPPFGRHLAIRRRSPHPYDRRSNHASTPLYATKSHPPPNIHT